MYSHKVTSQILSGETSCPPVLVSALWPAFDGWPCLLDGTTLLVTVPASAPAPADLGPLVKVEIVAA